MIVKANSFPKYITNQRPQKKKASEESLNLTKKGLTILRFSLDNYLVYTYIFNATESVAVVDSS
jgi:hypothetical protein